MVLVDFAQTCLFVRFRYIISKIIISLTNQLDISRILHTVDSRYLEFDGTMEKIRVNRSSTREEL